MSLLIRKANFQKLEIYFQKNNRENLPEKKNTCRIKQIRQELFSEMLKPRSLTLKRQKNNKFTSKFSENNFQKSEKNFKH